jgi:hypothetical protein
MLALLLHPPAGPMFQATGESQSVLQGIVGSGHLALQFSTMTGKTVGTVFLRTFAFCFGMRHGADSSRGLYAHHFVI